VCRRAWMSLNLAIAAGEFRDDCFAAPGFTGAARC
jgi:hypothetical protein